MKKLDLLNGETQAPMAINATWPQDQLILKQQVIIIRPTVKLLPKQEEPQRQQEKQEAHSKIHRQAKKGTGNHRDFFRYVHLSCFFIIK